MSEQFYNSGAPNTTGREVFEDSTSTGAGGQYTGQSQGGGLGSTGHGQGGGLGNSGLGSTGQGGTLGSGGVGDYPSGTGIGNAGQPGQGFGSGEHGHQGHHHQHGQHTHGQGVAGHTGEVAGLGQLSGNNNNNNNENIGRSQGQYESTGTGAGLGGKELNFGHGGDHHTLSNPGGAENRASRGDTGFRADEGHQHHGHHTHGDSYGANTAGTGVGDRTGHLQQDAALYERTGAGGPQTSGAAGTDRFDTASSGIDRSGAEGTGYGAKNSYPDWKEGERGSEPKGTGGIGGILGTSDKDFTSNRDRVAGSNTAYNDDNGLFKSNTQGPGGSALTGREGNSAINPVAQAEHGGHSSTTGTGLSSNNNNHGVGAGTHDTNEPHKKGIVEKIKEVLH